MNFIVNLGKFKFKKYFVQKDIILEYCNMNIQCVNMSAPKLNFVPKVYAPVLKCFPRI